MTEFPNIANAFGSTFAFFTTRRPTQKKSKELPSQHITTDSNTRQTSTNEKNNEPLTAPKKNGGGSANINSCAFNKHGAFRQFSASNSPLLLAANRYLQGYEPC